MPVDAPVMSTDRKVISDSVDVMVRAPFRNGYADYIKKKLMWFTLAAFPSRTMFRARSSEERANVAFLVLWATKTLANLK
jgi:hypothetical protein